MKHNGYGLEMEGNVIMCADCFEKYPVKDEQWPSRRWNREHTDYVDLSGGLDKDTCKCCGKKVRNKDEA